MDFREEIDCQSNGKRIVSLLSSYIKRQTKKRGLIGLLLKVGDLAVKITPNAADDVAWRKIRSYIKEAGKGA